MNKDVLESDRPIFIVGAPRSGTTLMRYCLNRHSRIYIPPETYFFARIYGNRNLILEQNIPRYAVDIVERFLNYRFSEQSNYHLKEYFQFKNKWIEQLSEGNYSYRDVAEIFFVKIAQNREKLRWGEKTPSHIFYIDFILELFPNAIIINMQRDPKNAIASYLYCSHLPDNFFLACAVYELSTIFARKYSHCLYTVQYEELTHFPERVLRHLCKYLGENFEMQMLKPGMRDSSYSKTAIEIDEKIGIIPDEAEKWKKYLTQQQSEFIDVLLNSKPKENQWDYWFDWIKVKRWQFLFLCRVYKNRYGYENLKHWFKR
jgi:hypothetical protein